MPEGEVGKAFVTIGGRLDNLQTALKKGLRDVKQTAGKMDSAFGKVKGPRSGLGGDIVGKFKPSPQLAKGLEAVTAGLRGLGLQLAPLALGLGSITLAGRAVVGIGKSAAQQTTGLVAFGRAVGAFGGTAKQVEDRMMSALRVGKNIVGEFKTVSNVQVRDLSTQLMREGFRPGKGLAAAIRSAIGISSASGTTFAAAAETVGRARRGRLSPEEARAMTIPGVGPGMRAPQQLAAVLRYGQQQAAIFKQVSENSFSGYFRRFVTKPISNIISSAGVGLSALDRGQFTGEPFPLTIAKEQAESVNSSIGLDPSVVAQRGGFPNIVPGVNDIRPTGGGSFDIAGALRQAGQPIMALIQELIEATRGEPVPVEGKQDVPPARAG